MTAKSILTTARIGAGRAVFAALACAGMMVAAADLAMAADSPFGGLKHDSSQPIEIVSDTLEVRQAEQIAIFTGSVEAKQGELTLTADQLDVFFDQDAEGAEDSETGAIRKVIAVGSVFLATASETAQGERAEYDVETGKIRMTGGVILNQGANAIKGEVLNIDLNTGLGRIESTGGGRVQSVFAPSKEQN